MKRLVWISVAMLVMVGILGYGLYTMRHIEEVNQRRREQNAGSEAAFRIVATTATTSIWDKLRETETTVDAAVESGEADPNENPEETLDSPSENVEMTDENGELIETTESDSFEETEALTEPTTLITVIVY